MIEHSDCANSVRGYFSPTVKHASPLPAPAAHLPTPSNPRVGRRACHALGSGRRIQAGGAAGSTRASPMPSRPVSRLRRWCTQAGGVAPAGAPDPGERAEQHQRIPVAALSITWEGWAEPDPSTSVPLTLGRCTVGSGATRQCPARASEDPCPGWAARGWRSGSSSGA